MTTAALLETRFEAVTIDWLGDPSKPLEFYRYGHCFTVSAHIKPEPMVVITVRQGGEMVWRGAHVIRNGRPRLLITQIKAIKSAKVLNIMEGIRAAVWGWGCV